MSDFNKLHAITNHNGIRKKDGGGTSGAPAEAEAALEKIESVALTLDNPERYRVRKAVDAAREAVARGDTAAVKRALASVQAVSDELTVAKATRDAIKNAPRFTGRDAASALHASRAGR